ncbi:hypothetical protein ACP4OV_010488 [Aristida adscensionis]
MPTAPDRSPPLSSAAAAAEEEEASLGSGSWPCRVRYAVGEEVEVRLTGRGFRGAHFEATIAARLPGSRGYEVVFSTLLTSHRGPPLLESVVLTHVRPRPPPAPPGREIKLFDLVEAYENDGWWPSVVSAVVNGVRPRKGKELRYEVSLPLFREVLKLPASRVRLRREFVCGRWIDGQEVLRGIPLYAEGSSVEVMCDKQKRGTAWMPATIITMVGTTNYVVQYGNVEGSSEVLHSRFIRPKPFFDKLKFKYELEPSTEVEVYQDGIWTHGVIADVGSSEPRRYGVRVKRHDSVDGDDYLLVSSMSLRPYAKWDVEEWIPCSTKRKYVLKHARKRYYADSECSLVSTHGGGSYRSSSVRNKRARKEKPQQEELDLSHALNIRPDTDRSSSNDVLDVEILSDNHVTEEFYTRIDGKGRRCLPKTLASERKDPLSVSSLDDVVEIGSKSSCVEVVVISDDSGYENVIAISDNSSSNRKKRKEQINLPDEELYSNHSVHCSRALWSASNLSQAQNTHHDLLLEAPQSEEKPCSHVVSYTLVPLKSSNDPSDKDGGQVISLLGGPVQWHLGINQTGEPPLSDHHHVEGELTAPGDSTAGDGNEEMCQELKEVKVKRYVAGTCNERADTDMINVTYSNQKKFYGSCGEVFSIEKPELPLSGQGDVRADIICMKASDDNKMETKGKSSEETSGSHMKINVERTEAKEIANVSHPEFNASLHHPLGQLQVSMSSKSAWPSSLLHPRMMADSSAFIPAPKSSTCAPVFSTSSFLLMPVYKMEIFKHLPQNPHFHELWDCPPEYREGKALELLLAFTNIAESIKNMRIQDDSQLYEERMSRLLDQEDNGFEVGSLKVRLHNLLLVRNRQICLKNRKATLDKELLNVEMVNCGVEQQLKLLDITGLWEKLVKYREMMASLVTKKTENLSYISKLHDKLHEVEESLRSAEADFNSIASAPWSLNAVC